MGVWQKGASQTCFEGDGCGRVHSAWLQELGVVWMAMGAWHRKGACKKGHLQKRVPARHGKGTCKVGQLQEMGWAPAKQGTRKEHGMGTCMVKDEQE
eukprot:1144311-Pelagomonas_calceolata.AAC.7